MAPGRSKLSTGYRAYDEDGNEIWVERKPNRTFDDDLDGPGSSASGLKGYHSSKVANDSDSHGKPTGSSVLAAAAAGASFASAMSSQPSPAAPIPPAAVSSSPLSSIPPGKPSPPPTTVSLAIKPPMKMGVDGMTTGQWANAGQQCQSFLPPEPLVGTAFDDLASSLWESLGHQAHTSSLPPPPAAGPLDFHPGPGSLKPISTFQHALPNSFEAMVQRFLGLAVTNAADWDLLVGCFFMHSGYSPMDVLWGAFGCTKWERDLVKLDRLAEGSSTFAYWEMTPEIASHHLVVGINIFPDAQAAFKEAMKRFAMMVDHDSRLAPILEQACWTRSVWGSYEWMVISGVKSMPDGMEKEEKLAQAKAELPRFFERCMNDPHCGSSHARNKCKTDDMAFAGGRPTQIHAVPYEERAVDTRGKKLPWAHEWPEGHPNARGHRRQPEEKGPFGKSSIRKSSSRATRTATPAKKDNPALDGFEQAWKYDQKKAAEAQQQASANKAPGDGTSIHRQLSHNKDPAQVILYGFSASTQWNAVQFYEGVSGGVICEDYDRLPPVELQRIPKTFSSTGPLHSRALTPAEKSLASKYHGGNHWIKVTFDSAEAAERAISCSPHKLSGHWVYAQEYRGVGPDIDEPILTRNDGAASTGAFNRPSQTLGSSFDQRSSLPSNGTATLPRSFASNAISQARDQGPNEVASSSPSTVSSATATGPNNYNLRNRHPSQTEENRSSTTSQANGQVAAHPQGFTHFPDIPRTVLRPASEAFLPHPTWSESIVQRLVNAGWIPGDFVGAGAPRLENGDFDYANASYYWRFFHWLDSTFGTDLCGMRD